MQALAIGGTGDKDYKNMRDGRALQKRRAEELHRLAAVPLGKCGIDELKQFQAVLPDFQIKVLSIDKPHCIIFKGPSECDKKFSS